MSLDFVAEVWDALRSHIDFNERKDAADTLVNLLIDSGHDADDIKESFRGDKDIGGALKFYREQHETEEEYEEYDDEEDDDW
jgi:hypothetical protein